MWQLVHVWHSYVTFICDISGHKVRQLWRVDGADSFIYEIHMWYIYVTWHILIHMWHSYVTFICDMHMWHSYVIFICGNSFIYDMHMWHTHSHMTRICGKLIHIYDIHRWYAYVTTRSCMTFICTTFVCDIGGHKGRRLWRVDGADSFIYEIYMWCTYVTWRIWRLLIHMGWLRLVGSLKLQISFAKEPYKRDYTLQKRPIILRRLLIIATPYSIGADVDSGGARASPSSWVSRVWEIHPRYHTVEHTRLSDTLHSSGRVARAHSVTFAPIRHSLLTHISNYIMVPWDTAYMKHNVAFITSWVWVCLQHLRRRCSCNMCVYNIWQMVTAEALEQHQYSVYELYHRTRARAASTLRIIVPWYTAYRTLYYIHNPAAPAPLPSTPAPHHTLRTRHGSAQEWRNRTLVDHEPLDV